MKTTQVLFLIFGLSIVLSSNCLLCNMGSQDDRIIEADEESKSSNSSENEENTSLNNLTNAVKELEETVNQLKDGEKVEVANFRELKKLMPEEINGMERKSNTGQKTGAMGFNVSNAEAKYQDGDRRMEINIVDIGGMGAAVAGMAAWTMVEIDKETEDGYERTTTIDGNKAFEKYNSRTKRGEVSIILFNRFIVTIKGWNVDIKDMKAALDELDFDDIEELQ